MKDIIKYKKSTPIKEIIEEVLWQSYSKHSDLSEYLLKEEIDIVDKAIKEFASQMGIIKTKDKKFEMSCFENSPAYIKFYDLENEKNIDYYDLAEIDRRYIDMKIDKWLGS